MYLVTKIFPKGANSARDMTKYFFNPTEGHWKSFKRTIRQLKLTKDTIKFTFRKPKELRMTQSVDRDLASVENWRSLSESLVTIGGCIIERQSQT